MAICPGARLGPYEVLSSVGAGGMAEVSRARDTRLDRIVAIKILPEHAAGRDGLREPFQRKTGPLSSPNNLRSGVPSDLASRSVWVEAENGGAYI